MYLLLTWYFFFLLRLLTIGLTDDHSTEATHCLSFVFYRMYILFTGLKDVVVGFTDDTYETVRGTNECLDPRRNIPSQ